MVLVLDPFVFRGRGRRRRRERASLQPQAAVFFQAAVFDVPRQACGRIPFCVIPRALQSFGKRYAQCVFHPTGGGIGLSVHRFLNAPVAPMILKIRTNWLEIAYEEGGPTTGPKVLLLHGWPDDARGWSHVATRLHAFGFHTFTPFLRGCGPTRFLSAETIRDGRGVALAQDAIDLADALGWESFAVAGHDWGARAAYTLAVLFPRRVTHVVGIGLAYQPRARFTLPPFFQARRFLVSMVHDARSGGSRGASGSEGVLRVFSGIRGAHLVGSMKRSLRRRPEALRIRIGRASRSRRVAHAGALSRWIRGFDRLQRRLSATENLATPTLMIQGGADTCDEPASSEGKERYFTAGYDRIVLPGIGHFPPREAPEKVADAIRTHLEKR